MPMGKPMPWLRGAVGAALAIDGAGLVTLALLGSNAAGLPWLVAPLGASAVLVFAVPASPLAQPWSVLGGNLISATIGLALGMVVGGATGSAMLAAGLAVGLAIAVMSLARCLHPPGGACALLCALGAAGPDGWGWAHLLPIAANVVTLIVIGLLYNNATGHRWPHVAPPPVPPVRSASHTRADVEQVLAGWDEVLDVSVDDLDAFATALRRHVAAREAR